MNIKQIKIIDLLLIIVPLIMILSLLEPTFREHFLYFIYYKPLYSFVEYYTLPKNYSLADIKDIYAVFNLHITIVFIIIIFVILSFSLIIKTVCKVNLKKYLILLFSSLAIFSLLFFIIVYDGNYSFGLPNFKNLTYYSSSNFSSYYFHLGLLFITTIFFVSWIIVVLRIIMKKLLKNILCYWSIVWLILFISVSYRSITDFVSFLNNKIEYGYNFSKEVRRESNIIKQPNYFMVADDSKELEPIIIVFNYYQYLKLLEIENDDGHGRYYTVFYLPNTRRLLYIWTEKEEETGEMVDISS